MQINRERLALRFAPQVYKTHNFMDKLQNKFFHTIGTLPS